MHCALFSAAATTAQHSRVQSHHDSGGGRHYRRWSGRGPPWTRTATDRAFSFIVVVSLFDIVVFGAAGDGRMPELVVNLYLNDEMIQITSFYHGSSGHMDVQVIWNERHKICPVDRLH